MPAHHFSNLEIEFPNAPKRIKNRAKEYKDRAKLLKKNLLIIDNFSNFLNSLYCI